jgi:hypothetical protein
MNLMNDSRLLRKGFHVFADSFFSSLNLANKLLWERTYLTGTLRKNRPMPQMIKNARPQAEDAVYALQGQNMLCCFRDHNRQKLVTLVSTFYNATNTLNGKPRIICAYNTFMDGVDFSDQMIVAYNDHRKCSKVWKKIISHISPYLVELLYSVLSEHITTDYVTTSVHTICNRKLSVYLFDKQKRR